MNQRDTSNANVKREKKFFLNYWKLDTEMGVVYKYRNVRVATEKGVSWKGNNRTRKT